MDELADGWQVWSEGEHRVVFAYRPDVFEGQSFPPACLPTIYVTRGRRSRRPGVDLDPDPGTPWFVTLFLEPEVERPADSYDDRAAALEGARNLARRFARGEVDFRGLYRITDDREAYLARLDELTGREA